MKGPVQTDPKYKKRIDFLYNKLAKEGIKNFPESAEKFASDISQNENMSEFIHKKLQKGDLIDNFPETHEEFRASLGLKKKVGGEEFGQVSPAPNNPVDNSPSDVADSQPVIPNEVDYSDTEITAETLGAIPVSDTEIMASSPDEFNPQEQQAAQDNSSLEIRQDPTESQLAQNRDNTRDPITKNAEVIYGEIEDKYAKTFTERASEMQSAAGKAVESQWTQWLKENPKSEGKAQEAKYKEIVDGVNTNLKQKVQMLESRYTSQIKSEARDTIESYLGIEKSKQGEGPSRLATFNHEFAKPFYQVPGTLAKGAGIILPKELGGEKLFEIGDMYNKAVEELLPSNPEYAQELQSQLAAGLGQVVSLIGTGLATGAAKTGTKMLGQSATKSVANMTTKQILAKSGDNLLKTMTSAPAVVGSMQMAVPEFEAAIRGGASENEALGVFVKNAGVGSILEQAPVLQFFKRLNGVTGGSVTKWLLAKGTAAFKGGFEEGVTEMLQGIYSNHTAKQTYDDTVKILDGVTEEGSLGFAVGFIINALGAQVKSARREFGADNDYIKKVEEYLSQKELEFDADGKKKQGEPGRPAEESTTPTPDAVNDKQGQPDTGAEEVVEPVQEGQSPSDVPSSETNKVKDEDQQPKTKEQSGESGAKGSEESSEKPPVQQDGENRIEGLDKTDKKGRKYSYFENVGEKDGVKTTSFSFNRSDKPKDQRNRASVPFDKTSFADNYNIDKSYTGELDPELRLELQEVRETSEGSAATFKATNRQTGGTTTVEIPLIPKNPSKPKVDQKEALNEVKGELSDKEVGDMIGVEIQENIEKNIDAGKIFSIKAEKNPFTGRSFYAVFRQKGRKEIKQTFPDGDSLRDFISKYSTKESSGKDKTPSKPKEEQVKEVKDKIKSPTSKETIFQITDRIPREKQAKLKSLVNDYISERENRTDLSEKETRIFNHLLPINQDSYNRYADQNSMPGSVPKSYFAKKNIESFSVDQIAQEASFDGIEVSPQDVTDFMNRYPNRPRSNSPTAQSLLSEIVEITGKGVDLPNAIKLRDMLEGKNLPNIEVLTDEEINQILESLPEHILREVGGDPSDFIPIIEGINDITDAEASRLLKDEAKYNELIAEKYEQEELPFDPESLNPTSEVGSENDNRQGDPENSSEGSQGEGQQEVAPAKKYGKKNKVFTEDAAAKARELLKKKLGEARSGLDPEMMQAGLTLAGYHVEAGARSFADYSKAMINDLGDGIKPYLRSFYESVRHYPLMDNKGMSTAENIDQYLKEQENESITSNNVEPDRPDGRLEDPLGSKDVPDERGGDRPSAREGRSQDGKDGSDQQSNSSVSADRNSVPGERSNTKLFGTDGGLRDTSSDTSPEIDRRDDGDSKQRILDEGDGQGKPDQASKKVSIQERVKAQKKANKEVSFKNNDHQNIRESLPLLYPEQQDDVIKLERRFAEEPTPTDPKKGMLFTNGTGTGKTFTGLGVVKRFLMQGKNNILIVTPTQQVNKVWEEESGVFGINAKILDGIDDSGDGVRVTTYANFRENKALKSVDFDLVLYDESHRLMESKTATESSTTLAHYKISNKNPQSALGRLTDIHPLWVRAREIESRQQEINDEMKSAFGSRLLALSEETDQLEEQYNEIEKEKREVYPELKERAQKASDTTKTLFLSATPFKTHFNLRYSNGYLFEWGSETTYEQATNVMSRVDPESRFFLDNFGSAYEWKHHRLQSKSDANPEAIAMQEVEFADKLMEKGAMSGRQIVSEFDYSREFPIVSGFNSEAFNQAFNDIYNYDTKEYDELRESARKVFGDYNYSTKLYEALRTSMSIERIDQHLELGRKVIVFHRRHQGDTGPPYETLLQDAEIMSNTLKLSDNGKDKERGARMQEQVDLFREKHRDLLEYEQTIDYRSTVEQLKDKFGDVLVEFNGTVPKKKRAEGVKSFNDDNSDVRMIVVQEESGKEGISLHDKSGKHQRVLMSMSLPQSTTTALQVEGRPYRLGNESNAIFEYPILGLDTEVAYFGQNLNKRLSTTENLSMGSKARDLLRSYSEGVSMNSSTDAPSTKQGFGGKEMDRKANDVRTPFEKAKLVYSTNQKKRGNRSQREGYEYYATPEPLGQKMMEWLNLKPSETALEPSAGMGSIAMWTPAASGITAIEREYSLYSKLMGRVANGNSTFHHQDFMDFNKINKFEGVAMNPPFGQGGALGWEHTLKGLDHLRKGGRLVTILPSSPKLIKKIEEWSESKDSRDFAIRGRVALPSSTFSQHSTGVNTFMLVVDRVNWRDESVKNLSYQEFDLRYAESVNELFDAIEEVQFADRYIDESTVRPTNTRKAIDDLIADTRDKRIQNSDNTDGIASIEQSTHEKTGEKQFITKLNERVDGDVFQSFKKKAKEINNGFWYKNKSGFIFKSMEDAESFRNWINNKDASTGRTANFQIARGDGRTFQQMDVASRKIGKVELEALVNRLKRSIKGFDVSTSKRDFENAFRKYQEGSDDALFQTVKATKNFYSNTMKALGAINQTKATGEQWKAMLLKNGASNAEMDWIDFDQFVIDNPKATKDQVKNYIESNKIEVEEVVKTDTPSEYRMDRKEAMSMWSKNIEVLGVDSEGQEAVISDIDEFDDYEYFVMDGQMPDTDPTKYSQYTLPGGENYKELLLKMPTSNFYNVENYKAFPTEVTEVFDKHVDDGFSISKDLEGLGYEIIDQDPSGDFTKFRKGNGDVYTTGHWAEPNILSHIRFNERTVGDDKVLFIEEIQSDWAQEGRKRGFTQQRSKIVPIDVIKNAEGLFDVYHKGTDNLINTGFFSEQRARYFYETSQPTEGAPNMPFKRTQDWVNLSMRRMIRYAAENGFDRIAWVTGEQSAERYDLSKQISKINAIKDNDGNYQLGIFDKSNNLISQRQGVDEDSLENFVGKEMAKKISSIPTGGSKVFTGLDLKVGGEGMKSFYDNIVPKAVSKILKKLDKSAQIEPIDLNTPSRYTQADENLLSELEDRDSDSIDEGKTLKSQQLSFPITSGIKDASSEGMPLFQQGTMFGDDPNMAEGLPKTKRMEMQEKLKISTKRLKQLRSMPPAGQSNLVKEEIEALKKEIVRLNEGIANTLSADKAREGGEQQALFQRGPETTPMAFVFKDKIYFNPELVRADTPVHEFAHIWLRLAKNREQPLYKSGMSLVKNSVYHEQVKADPYYSTLSETDQLEEALAIAIGEKGALLESQGGFKKWASRLWDKIKAFFGVRTELDLFKINLDQFVKAGAKDLLSGMEISKLSSLRIPETATMSLRTFKTSKNAWKDVQDRVEVERMKVENPEQWTKVKQEGRRALWDSFMTNVQDETRPLAMVQNEIVNNFIKNLKNDVNESNLTPKEKRRRLKLIDSNKGKYREQILSQKDVHSGMDLKSGKSQSKQEFIRKLFFGWDTGTTGFETLDFLTQRTKGGEAVVDPNSISAKLKKEGLTMVDVGFYAMVKHAKNFNEKTKNISIERGDEQVIEEAVMTDDQIEMFMQDFEESGKIDVLENYWNIMREELVTKPLQMKLEAGLITEKLFNTLSDPNEAGDFANTYVPMAVAPKAFNKKGLSKGILGRGIRKVIGTGKYQFEDRVNPFIQLISEFDKTIADIETNDVNKRLLKLVKDNPQPQYWKVHSPETFMEADPITGQEKLKTIGITQDEISNSIKVMVGGKAKYIELLDPNLKQVFQSAGGNASNKAQQLLFSTVNNTLSYFRLVYTAVNPDFVLPNFFRDTMDAIVNLSEDEIKGIKRNTVKSIPKAMKGIRDFEKGNFDSEWSIWYADMKENGGEIAWLNYQDAEKEYASIEKEIARFKESSASKKAGNYAMMPFRFALRSVLVTNKMVEVGVRLSTYVNFVKAGQSKEKAALAAKNVTVNFNKKGKWGPVMNAIWLFSGSAIQGITRSTTALVRSKRARMTVAGMMGSWAMINAWNDLMDEDDELRFITDYEREKNMVIFNPMSPAKPLLIPISYNMVGWKSISDNTYAVSTGKKEPVDAAVDVAGAFFKAMWPLESMGFPTLTQPAAEIYFNQTFYNKKQMRPTKYDPSKKDSEMYYANARKNSVDFAAYLSTLSEGNDDLLEISPETIDYLLDYSLGGMKAVLNSTDLAQQMMEEGLEGFDVNKLMVGRRFMVDMTKQEWRPMVQYSNLYKKGVVSRITKEEYQEMIKLGNSLKRKKLISESQKDRYRRKVKKVQREDFNNSAIYK